MVIYSGIAHTLSLSGNMMDSPWAVNSADDGFRQLDSCLGPYCLDMMDEWAMDDEFDAEKMTPSPNTWSGCWMELQVMDFLTK